MTAPELDPDRRLVTFSNGIPATWELLLHGDPAWIDPQVTSLGVDPEELARARELVELAEANR